MRLRPATNSLARWLVVPFALAAAAGLALLHRWPELGLRLAHCPLRDVTGLPCPTCGGTHAAAALAAGDPAGAWRENPAVPVGAVLLLAWLVWAVGAALVPAWRVELALGPREKKAARWGAALGLAALWARQLVVL